MGECPEWYALFEVAKRCNCAVWELLDAPLFWIDKALIAISAENQARKILENRK